MVSVAALLAWVDVVVVRLAAAAPGIVRDVAGLGQHVEDVGQDVLDHVGGDVAHQSVVGGCGGHVARFALGLGIGRRRRVLAAALLVTLAGLVDGVVEALLLVGGQDLADLVEHVGELAARHVKRLVGRQELAQDRGREAGHVEDHLARRVVDDQRARGSARVLEQGDPVLLAVRVGLAAAVGAPDADHGHGRRDGHLARVLGGDLAAHEDEHAGQH